MACDDERCKMADGSNATRTGVPRTGRPSRTIRTWRTLGEPRLGAVTAAFTLAQLVLVRPDLGLGWDETVYVSQVSGHVPAAYFSAPRSRGISLLVAPIAFGYAAPRFLLPAYTLLALPVALGLVHLVTAPAHRVGRALAVGLVPVGLAGHLAVQYVVLEHTVHSSAASRADWARTAAALHTRGVRPPFLLSGYDAVPIAFYTGCGSAQTAGHDASTTVAELTRAAHRTSFAVLAPPGGRPPAYAGTWPEEKAGGLRAYVAPDVRQVR